MDYNKLAIPTSQKVQDVMRVLNQLQMQRKKLNEEIDIVFNELYVLVNSLLKSENVDLSICSSVCSMIYDTPTSNYNNDNYNNNNNSYNNNYINWNNNNNNNINNNRNNNNNVPKKKNYNYKSIYKSLNAEGKIRWRLLKRFINKHELEVWGHC
jgi:predicted HNH restriction endonuclease